MRAGSILLYFITFVCSAGQLFSQTIVEPYWDMQQVLPSNTNTTYCSVSELSQGNNYGNTVFLNDASASFGYIGASGYQNASMAARGGVLQKEASGSAYLEFSINPAPGYRVQLLGFSVGMRSTLTGPQQWNLFQSDDQFLTPLATGSTLNNSTWNLVSISGVQFSFAKQIHFRLYGFGGEGTQAINIANWRMDDLVLQLKITPDNLPVKWLSQEASSYSSHVTVEWSTGEEINCDSFFVERSGDGIYFERLTGLVAQSDDNGLPVQRSYKYIDQYPLSDISFYRILEKDKDGAVQFGKVLVVNRQQYSNNQLIESIYYHHPLAAVRVKLKQQGSFKVQLYTLQGQSVGAYILKANSGWNEMRINPMLKGFYIAAFFDAVSSNFLGAGKFFSGY